MKNEEIVLTSELTLREFIDCIRNPQQGKLYYPIARFPTDRHLNEFLGTIHDISEKEFREILRHFIPKSGTYGKDLYLIPALKQWKNNIPHNKTLEEQAIASKHYIEDTEYYKRLTIIKSPADNVWEGLTWIIDLLPHFPNDALKALNAYFQANCQFLPDDLLNAIGDCSAMISARYIDKEQPRDVFLNLSPKDFEKLVASIYVDEGYDTNLTKSSYDGGIDIVAEKSLPTFTEKIVIQCKNCKSKISVDEVRNLLGVVYSSKVTKGILATSSDFTREAVKFAKANPQIELLNYKQLITLLNKKHGPYWIHKIDNHIRIFS